MAGQVEDHTRSITPLSAQTRSQLVLLALEHVSHHPPQRKGHEPLHQRPTTPNYEEPL